MLKTKSFFLSAIFNHNIYMRLSEHPHWIQTQSKHATEYEHLKWVREG